MARCSSAPSLDDRLGPGETGASIARQVGGPNESCSGEDWLGNLDVKLPECLTTLALENIKFFWFSGTLREAQVLMNGANVADRVPS